VLVEAAGAISDIVEISGEAWEWLHTTDGSDPTADANFATNWKTPGDASLYGAAGGFSAGAPGFFGFGRIDLLPGVTTDIGTPLSLATGNVVNNAAYFRASFTTATPLDDLWIEILADDAAYIYVDDRPGIPVNIRLTGGIPDPDAFLTSACAAANTTLTEDATTRFYLSSLIGTLPPAPTRSRFPSTKFR